MMGWELSTYDEPDYPFALKAYGLFRLCWLVLAWLLRGFHGVEPQGAL
jgi:hypothetical protein